LLEHLAKKRIHIFERSLEIIKQGSGRVKGNVSRYFGISCNTLEKEKEIVNAAGQNPELFGELVKKEDLKKISVDKAFHKIQKQIKKAKILASIRSTNDNSSSR
jgi:hypothetical protein